MGRKSELRAISYISIGGAPPVRFDSLDPKTRDECLSKMFDNIGMAMSKYLSEHPKEAIPIINEARQNNLCY